ncbi:proton-conducting membrane transporter [Halegenticoccus soli]|uniref:proton-conducting membrane transporter n=1 Tax=Halegenticoccus soli TaxID=1985678 RepID=UPI001E367C69|nr:proton-conducting membrane transporter [Halegenticoccus soli]
MTDGPDAGSNLLPGLAAVGLFLVMVLAFAGASFPAPQGFGGDANVTASIGYAMFDIGNLGDVGAEGFLAAFLIVAIVLDVAIDGAVFLAKREEGGSVVTALTDGGRDLLDRSREGPNAPRSERGRDAPRREGGDE